MSTAIAIGPLFVIGYPGAEPSRDFLDFIRAEQIGGVILFADNCADESQLRDSVTAIREQYNDGPSPLVAIDQEGGRVCRIKGRPAEYGAAGDYGLAGDVEQFARDYAAAAQHMSGLGINLNLAPVADLALVDNACLNGRCFGGDPKPVAKFISRSVEVAHENRLLCCLKHFPGLGAAEIDPHQATAVAGYDENIWRSRERIPFAAGIAAGADLVMTTHLKLPRLNNRIATGSPRIVTDWLRRDLGFEGAVVTDDLCMAGTATLGSPGDRCLAALEAGHDLLLFGQDLDTSRRAYEELRTLVSDDRIEPGLVTSALARVANLKLKLDEIARRA